MAPSSNEDLPPEAAIGSVWRWGIIAFPATVRSLTALAGTSATPAPGANAVFYPVVGLLLGTVALVVDWGSSVFGGMFVRSSAVLLALLLCTAARPHRALGRLIEVCLSRRNRRAALQLLEEPGDRISRGLAAAAAGFELFLLCELDRFRPFGLLFAPTLGYCSMVVLAVGSRAARPDGRRVKFAPSLTFNEFAVASTLTFAVIFLTSEFLGLLLVLCAASLSVGLRVLFHHWLGGVNTTVLDAASEISTFVTLALLASF